MDESAQGFSETNSRDFASDPSATRVPGFRNTSATLPIAEGKAILPGELTYPKDAKDPEGIRFRLIESEAAWIVARSLAGEIAWDGEAATWFAWRGDHWAPLINVDQAEGRIVQAVAVGTDYKSRDGVPLGFRVSYAAGIVAVIQKLDLLPRPPRPQGVVPFRNGLLDVATGTLKPATPDYALDFVLPFDYDPGATCPNIRHWLLNTVDGDQETVELLRAWLAALLRGIHLQRFLLLLGRGGTGKGTFQRLVETVLGAGNVAVSSLRNLEENRFETAKLLGKQLCMINEAGRHGGALNMLKAITGGDSLPIEKKHVQQSGSFVFTGGVLMASNEDLQSSDSTSGLERRRVMVRLSRTASQEERADWVRRGGEEAVLHAEIPGLVNWCLGLPDKEIRRRFEKLPQRVKDDNLLGLAAGNSVADWLLAETEFDPDAIAQIGVYHTRKDAGYTTFDNADVWLYPSYHRYCYQTGRARPVSARKFKDTVVDISEHLGHIVIARRDPRSRAHSIQGIKLLPPEAFAEAAEDCGTQKGSQAPLYRKDRKEVGKNFVHCDENDREEF